MFTLTVRDLTHRINPLKFVVTDKGEVICGRVEFHKHLRPEGEVIAAGMVPYRVSTPASDTFAWGDWDSMGYRVETPLALREPLRMLFIEHAERLGLWNG